MENKKKIFVGNLPFSMTQDGLQELFSEFGEITQISLITDRMTGRSKGFAFVEFAEESAADAATKKQIAVEGRELVINIARPREPRNDSFPRRDNNRSFGNSRPQNRDRRY
ncbi:MAG TPA: RNA-binding protein [Candidatus Pacebacteria bacterium]|nr:RNA-binding protein [Candidatus Paceibacterota bacterium]